MLLKDAMTPLLPSQPPGSAGNESAVAAAFEAIPTVRSVSVGGEASDLVVLQADGIAEGNADVTIHLGSLPCPEVTSLPSAGPHKDRTRHLSSHAPSGAHACVSRNRLLRAWRAPLPPSSHPCLTSTAPPPDLLTPTPDLCFAHRLHVRPLRHRRRLVAGALPPHTHQRCVQPHRRLRHALRLAAGLVQGGAAGLDRGLTRALLLLLASALQPSS